MKKILCFIMAMIIAIMEMAPVNAKAAEGENEVLPFSLEATEEHVEDAEVIAKKLVLTSDNASIVDTGLTDLVVVKEIVHSVQAKVYLISSKGVLHTFLVDADDPWLDKLEEKIWLCKLEVKEYNGSITSGRYYKARPHLDAFNQYQWYDYYEDVLFSVCSLTLKIGRIWTFL